MCIWWNRSIHTKQHPSQGNGTKEMLIKAMYMAVPWLQSQASHCRGTGSIPQQSTWDLWWIKWHWNRLFSEYFRFPMSGIIATMLHTHISLTYQCHIISATDSIVKGKVVCVHTMKAYRRSRGIAPLIHNLGSRWR